MFTQATQFNHVIAMFDDFTEIKLQRSLKKGHLLKSHTFFKFKNLIARFSFFTEIKLQRLFLMVIC